EHRQVVVQVPAVELAHPVDQGIQQSLVARLAFLFPGGAHRVQVILDDLGQPVAAQPLGPGPTRPWIRPSVYISRVQLSPRATSLTGQSSRWAMPGGALTGALSSVTPPGASSSGGGCPARCSLARARSGATETMHNVANSRSSCRSCSSTCCPPDTTSPPGP